MIKGLPSNLESLIPTFRTSPGTFDQMARYFELKLKIGEDFDLDNLDDFIHLTNHSVQGNVEFFNNSVDINAVIYVVHGI